MYIFGENHFLHSFIVILNEVTYLHSLEWMPQYWNKDLNSICEALICCLANSFGRIKNLMARSHYTGGEMWKRSFVSSVRRIDHTNPLRKQCFWKTLLKQEKFENAGFAFLVWTVSIILLQKQLSENDSPRGQNLDRIGQDRIGFPLKLFFCDPIRDPIRDSVWFDPVRSRFCRRRDFPAI